MAQYNGVKASWSNFVIKFRSDEFSFDPEDFSACDWKQTLTPGKVPGRGSGYIGRTEGEYETEAKITIARRGAETLLQYLRDAHPLGKAGLTEFDVQLQWVPYNDEAALEAEWRGCRVVEAGISIAKGGDAAMVDMPIDVMRIFDGGVCLIGDE